MLVATAILVFSIAGLVVLVGLKAWELHAGRLLFARFRPHAGEHSARMLRFAHAEFPYKLARAFRITRRVLRAYASYVFAKALFYFERALERILHRVRATPTNLKERGEASPFLREVAAYKRMLDREVENKKVAPFIE